MRALLSGASDDELLLGERGALHLLRLRALDNHGAEESVRGFKGILEAMGKPIAIPEDLDAALEKGLGAGGFPIYKIADLRQILAYASTWKDLDLAHRDAALADPWAFKQFVAQVPVLEGASYAREVLLDAVHPKFFERIFSATDKEKLVRRLGQYGPPASDIDKRIFLLREHLADRLGSDFDWYSTIGARILRRLP